jgi:ABC-type lipoprotein release transport system permease subunit
VLDQALAEVLRVDVGQSVWVSPAPPPNTSQIPTWYEAATEFTVVGISGAFWLVPSAELAFVYLSELQQLEGSASASKDYATFLLIHLQSPTDPGADQALIASKFPGLSVFTLADLLGEIQHVVNVYRTFGDLIAAIGLVVAVLFVTTVLQMSVDDRSRELALLRAIGRTRASVGAEIVGEGLALSGIGLAVGLPLAYVGAEAINRFLLRLIGGLPNGFSFVAFNAEVVGTGVAAVVAVGLAASTFPAIRAMLLPVAEELRAP